MMFMNLSKIATLNNNGVDLCCIINKISKNEAISLLKNVDLIEKSGIKQNKTYRHNTKGIERFSSNSDEE